MKDLKKYYILMIAMFVSFNLLIVYVSFADGELVFLNLAKDNQTNFTNPSLDSQKQLSETQTDKYNNDNKNLDSSKENDQNSIQKSGKDNSDQKSNQSSIQSNLSNKNYSIPFEIFPEDKSKSNDKYLYLSGKTLPEVEIKIGNSVTTSNVQGEFSMLIFLSKNENVFTLEVKDINKDTKLIEDQITYFYTKD